MQSTERAILLSEMMEADTGAGGADQRIAARMPTTLYLMGPCESGGPHPSRASRSVAPLLVF